MNGKAWMVLMTMVMVAAPVAAKPEASREPGAVEAAVAALPDDAARALDNGGRQMYLIDIK